MAAVEDTKTGEIVLWYDFDAGPDFKNIEKLPSGEWVVTLAPRAEDPLDHGAILNRCHQA